MSLFTQTVTQTLSAFNCWKCGITFAITADLEKRRRSDHEVFYCPNGHGNYFNGKTKEEKENEQLQQELKNQQNTIQYLREAKANLHTELTEQKHKLRAEKGAKTRLKNRVAHGVCPCCNRTFQNLLNHMQTQHPEYQKA
jgi:hypothetical protein